MNRIILYLAPLFVLSALVTTSSAGSLHAIQITNISWNSNFTSYATGTSNLNAPPNVPINYYMNQTEVRYALINISYYSSMGQSCQYLEAQDNVTPAPLGNDINFAVVNCTGSSVWIVVHQGDTNGNNFNSFTLFFGSNSIQGENGTTLTNWRFENESDDFDLSSSLSPNAFAQQYGLPYIVTLSQNTTPFTLATLYAHTPRQIYSSTISQAYNKTNSTWGLNDSKVGCVLNNVTPQSKWLYYNYNLSSRGYTTIASSALRALITYQNGTQSFFTLYNYTDYNSTNAENSSTCSFTTLVGLTSVHLPSNASEWASAQFVATNISTVGNAYVVTPSITITPSKAILDQSQDVTLNAAVSRGAVPYSYQWILNGDEVGTNSSTFTFNANATAKYSGVNNVTLRVTSAAGVIANSTVKITTKKDPKIKLTTNYTSTKLDIGQSTGFTANIPSGGEGPFTVNFMLLGNVMFTSTSLHGLTKFEYTPSSKGSFVFNAIATDTGTTLPYLFSSGTQTIKVYNAPVLTLKPSSAKLGVGKDETYTIKLVSGGVGPFTIELYDITNSVQVGSNVTISAPGKSNTISFTTTGPGFYTYEGIATDHGTSYPFVINSTSNTIDVT